MPVRPVIRAAAAAGGLLLSGGCTLGPDPARPATPVDAADAAYADPAAAGAEAWEAAGWWRRFADEPAERLVKAVIANNPDLAAASARVEEAGALLGAASGALLPELSLGFTPSRQQRFLDFPGIDGTFRSEVYDVRLSARWDVDLWGRQRREREAAYHRERQARARRLATAHTLVAETLRARIDLGVLAQRLRLARADAETRERTLEVVKRSWAGGLADATDYALAQEALLSSEAAIPPLEESLVLTRNALAVLLGTLPARVELPGAFGMPALPDPPPPAGVPAALLDRRPDLLVAEFRSAADQAEVGARVAELLPNVVLRADAGYANADAAEILDGDFFVWSLAADLVQSVFYRGVLLGRVEAAEAAARASAAEYVGVVLEAVREVEDALASDAASREALARRAAAAKAAARSEELALRDYRRGAGDLLRVLDASRRRRAADDAAALARRDVWFAGVALHLALGGDWALPEPAPGTAPPTSAPVAGTAAGTPTPAG